jgi:hypothetical protein
MHLLLTLPAGYSEEHRVNDWDDFWDGLREDLKHLENGKEIVIRRADYLVTQSKNGLRLVQGGK